MLEREKERDVKDSTKMLTMIDFNKNAKCFLLYSLYNINSLTEEIFFFLKKKVYLSLEELVTSRYSFIGSAYG